MRKNYGMEKKTLDVAIEDKTRQWPKITYNGQNERDDTVLERYFYVINFQKQSQSVDLQYLP